MKASVRDVICDVETISNLKIEKKSQKTIQESFDGLHVLDVLPCEKRGICINNRNGVTIFYTDYEREMNNQCCVLYW